MTKYTHLLEAFKPNHYDLDLQFNDSKEHFSGSVTINGEVCKDTGEVKLHSRDLTIISASIDGQDVKTNLLPESDELVLTPAAPLTAGEIVITVKFEADITKPMNGIYPCFFEHEGEKKRLIATQFESHHAREAFPCVDEPAAKATFSLTTTTPKNETVFGNMEITEQSETDAGLVTQFEKTPIMSTYLLAFAFGDLGFVSATAKDGTEVRIIATPDNVQHLDFALDVAVRTLDFYNDYFQIPFPLKKVDHIALPDFAAGAMENWGLITYRESALLLDKEHGSIANKQRVAIVIAHELAHQWFGNLVTMTWWTDLWLNEGFASWMEYLAIDSLFPDWQMWTQFIADDMFRGMSLDSLESSHPVEVSIEHPNDIRGIFDAISYSKGASVIRMLHGFLGAEDFQKGIQHYLNTHKYANATTADLWAALEEVSNKPVTDFMSAWTSKTGFPIVSATENGNELKLSQQRYLINPSAQPDSTLWPIPLAKDDTDMLMKSKEMTIDASKITKINSGQAGFYAVAYDSNSIKRLTAEAQAGTLQAEDRMGLIHDTWLTARSGDSSTVDALTLLNGFENEDNAAVWDAISGEIGLLKRALGSDELNDALRPLVGRLARESAKRLGWSIKDTDTHFDKLMRPVVLGMSCFANDETSLTQVDKLFAAMKTPEDIQADIRGVVMVTSARRGNEETYEKLLNAYRSTQSAQLKAPIIAGLTSFDQPELIQRTLDLITSDEVKLQEVHNWIGGIFMNRKAKAVAWIWLKENWNWFVEQFGSDIMTFAYIPKYAAASMNTEEELADFTEYCSQAATEGIARQIAQARETIEWQSAWRKRDHDAVVSFLKAN